MTSMRSSLFKRSKFESNRVKICCFFFTAKEDRQSLLPKDFEWNERLIKYPCSIGTDHNLSNKKFQHHMTDIFQTILDNERS